MRKHSCSNKGNTHINKQEIVIHITSATTPLGMAFLLRSWVMKAGQYRSIFTSAIRYDSNNIHNNLHKVNNLEKRFLVWTRKFKTIEEVPAMVPTEVVEKARNRMRIRIANLMMAATLIACLGVAIHAKGEHKKGVTVTQMNLDWHKKMDAEYAAKESKAQ